jgi:hypothetical protein
MELSQEWLSLVVFQRLIGLLLAMFGTGFLQPMHLLRRSMLIYQLGGSLEETNFHNLDAEYVLL